MRDLFMGLLKVAISIIPMSYVCFLISVYIVGFGFGILSIIVKEEKLEKLRFPAMLLTTACLVMEYIHTVHRDDLYYVCIIVLFILLCVLLKWLYSMVVEYRTQKNSQEKPSTPQKSSQINQNGNPTEPARNPATNKKKEEYPNIPFEDVHPPMPVEIEDEYRYPQYISSDSDLKPIKEDIICDGRSFVTHFTTDLRTFKHRVVIYSPFIAEARLHMLLPLFDGAIRQGKQIVVVTKDILRRNEKKSEYRKMESTLRSHGIRIVYRGDMHEKLVFIDHEAVWVGSLNALSFTGTTGEVMHRHTDRKTVAEYAKMYQIDAIK